MNNRFLVIDIPREAYDALFDGNIASGEATLRIVTVPGPMCDPGPEGFKPTEEAAADIVLKEVHNDAPPGAIQE